MENGWNDPRINLATFVGFAVVILGFIITYCKTKKRDKQRKIAIEKGNIIKAKCVRVYKKRKKSNYGNSESFYRGRYEYTVDGKVKHYAIHSNYTVPKDYLELYYTDSPRKVFSDYDHNGRFGVGLAILLGIIACVAIMYLSGYFANPELYEMNNI